MNCDHCGRQSNKLPYTCKWCGNSFCVTHRLPESHDCIGLKVTKAEQYLKREYGDERDVQPWFKDTDSRESRRISDNYRESHASQSCEICSKLLFNQEAWKCPSCDEIVCEEHLDEHRSNCSEKRKSGGSNDIVQNWKQQSEPASKSEGSRRRERSEELKRAAQKVEEKRTPNYEPTPDVGFDGSVVQPNQEESEDELEKDVGTISTWSPRAIHLTLGAISVVTFAVWWLFF